MGCSASSTNKGSASEALPKLLTAGGPEKKVEDFDSEANRKLIVALDSQSLADLIQEAAAGGGAFSIRSTSDEGLMSFADKKTTTEGSEGAPANIGYTCRKGLKPQSPNQDSWTQIEVPENFAIYGVFDGHGQAGHDISDYVTKTLPKLILADKHFQAWTRADRGSGERDLATLEEVVKECFKQMQSLIATAHVMQKFDAFLAGTTATMCIFDHKAKKYLVAHVADSTCVLGKQGSQADALTQDHKPELPAERARIEAAGGQVVFDGYANHRLFAKNGLCPGINMSRCLGDLFGHVECGVSAEPETRVCEVAAEDTVLLLCSDGVWEFIDPATAVSIAMEFYEQGHAGDAADKLAKEAWDRWIKEEGGAVVDDITAVCVFLNQKQPEIFKMSLAI